jgi:hypothetical protein
LDEEFWKMDRRDQKFLDKQMRRTVPPAPNHGVAALVLLTVFLAGMTAGGYLYAYANPERPTRLASSAAAPATQAHIAVPIAR